MTNEKEIWFELKGRNKYEWLRSARNLYTTSLILYKESAEAFKKLADYLEKAGSADDAWFPEAGTFQVARMLAGLALENLVKGIIVRKCPEKVSSGTFLLNHHDTLSLINEHLQKEIALSKEDRMLMAELIKAVEWKGKYPMPLRAHQFEDPKNIKNEVALFESIYNDLKILLEAK